MRKGRDRGRILHRFLRNKSAMFGTVLFLLVFLTVQIGPLFFPLDLSYSEATQSNVPPGRNFLTIPKELNGKIQEISAGPTFHAVLTTEGKVHVFGHGKVAGNEDVAEIPEEVQNSTIVKIAAGYDHIVAVSSENEVYVWGNKRLNQGNIPGELKNAGKITSIAAGNQCSAAITEKGEAFLWGNSNLSDIKVKKEYQGQFHKISFTGFACIALLKDGSVVYPGRKETAVSRLPQTLLTRSAVDIAGTAQSAAAVLTDGRVILFGNTGKGEGTLSEDMKKRGFSVTTRVQDGVSFLEISSHTEKVTALSGGRYHYLCLTETGKAAAFGADTLKQTALPAALQSEKVQAISSGGYTNFLLTASQEAEGFGFKGYTLGTDELGRDILARILAGGRMTMTVGAVAVIISTLLGILIGGISGYFGGKTDLFLQRFAEIIASLPFLPFAMILSSIIGSSVSENRRIILIMVVLGVLSWTGLSRLVRAKVLSEREKEFVLAAKAIGVSERKIVFRHIVPNVLSIILVSATLDFATCMLTESSLSYLGFGVLPPQPTWGNMLSGANSSTVIQNSWWRWVFPAVIFGICTICINLIGDGLRDAVDPKSESR